MDRGGIVGEGTSAVSLEARQGTCPSESSTLRDRPVQPSRAAVATQAQHARGDTRADLARTPGATGRRRPRAAPKPAASRARTHLACSLSHLLSYCASSPGSASRADALWAMPMPSLKKPRSSGSIFSKAQASRAPAATGRG